MWGLCVTMPTSLLFNTKIITGCEANSPLRKMLKEPIAPLGAPWKVEPNHEVGRRHTKLIDEIITSSYFSYTLQIIFSYANTLLHFTNLLYAVHFYHKQKV